MRVKSLLSIAAVAWAASGLAADAPPEDRTTELGVRGTQFTLNGKPTFLLGASYYGALGADDATIRKDLAGLREHGFNWLRVWATWTAFGHDVSAVDADGRPREPFMARLVQLVAECDRQGLVVDVTLSRGNGGAGPARLGTADAHRRAVESLLAALSAHRNWYLDLANERNIGDARHVGFDELVELRALVRRLDPARLVTASHGGDMSREEVEHYLRRAQVDFLTPHRPRDAKAIEQTADETREYLAWAQAAGREVPVHYQEPLRRGYEKFEPTADQLFADLAGAQAGGAAGWCFHNGASRGRPDERPRRSFDLGDGSLLDQLDREELRLLDLVSEWTRQKAP